MCKHLVYTLDNCTIYFLIMDIRVKGLIPIKLASPSSHLTIFMKGKSGSVCFSVFQNEG